jgi:diaminopimelate epimerase
VSLLDFIKTHGLGNDFVLVDALYQDFKYSPGLEELARIVCERHTGIGADGLVLILPSETADARMRFFNPDGSEAQMCGNAIRCVARYLYERALVSKTVIRVETLAGIMKPEVILEGGQISGIRVDMGEPRLERSQIPMAGPPGQVIGESLFLDGHVYTITALSMGNPHCVIFVQNVEQVQMEQIGPRLETHPAFPERTNVEFVEVINPGELKMYVWERGAGLTLACGTGACAAAVAGALNGLTQKEVKVRLPLGYLNIEWARNNHVYMTGPAEEVFSGSFPV